MLQTYDDWELIISDNDSSQDIKGYIDSLNDARIKYYRTREFVSVTRNWNNALEQATGNYVIMLGDDDCLMPDFCKTVAELAERFENPDLIYTDAYLYSYPGIFPEYPNGFLQLGYNVRFTSREPFLLGRDEAIEIVGEALAMKDPLSFNMQVSTIRREYILSLQAQGAFFQSPFPDYYATIATFLTAKRILIYQQPIVVIGISPKSYGYFFFNRKENEGILVLNNSQELHQSRLEEVLLPGSWEATCRLVAMETVVSNYRDQLEPFGFSVDVARYRRIQMDYNWAAYKQLQTISSTEFEHFRHQLNWLEWLRYWYAYKLPKWLFNHLPAKLRGLAFKLIHFIRAPKAQMPPPKRVTDVPTILDVLKRMQARI